MWIVKDEEQNIRGKSKDLNVAMEMAKYIDEFVIITNGSMEIVGKFGVDSIKNGKCPDGIDYTWVKRRTA